MQGHDDGLNVAVREIEECKTIAIFGMNSWKHEVAMHEIKLAEEQVWGGIWVEIDVKIKKIIKCIV